MFAGIYYGGMYGGSTTSILLNTPGESSSVVTAIEGNKMAKRGRAAPGAGDRRDRLVRGRHHRARSLLVFARAAGRRLRGRASGPPDYFAIMLLAFIAVTAVLGSSAVRGLASLASA